MARVLVACLGSGLVGDLAAGAAIHGLVSRSTLPEEARLVLLPPGMLRLLQVLDGEDALVAVGEVEMGGRPGTVHVLDWREVPLGADQRGRNGHVMRVTMEAARIQAPERAPRQAFLVGIEGRAPLSGEGAMHPEVAGALARAAGAVLDLAHGLAGLRQEEIRAPRPARTRRPALLVAAH